MREGDTPVPVEEGEEYVVDVEDIGDEGDGIAHVEDFVVLVPDGEMGERARVRIENVEPGFGVAEVLEHETGAD